jgi:hypothetical protein
MQVDVPLGEQADPIQLSTDAIASRIVITPRDELVAVTYGEGDNAWTKVFRVPDGKRVQIWKGAMVSGRADVGELPGLRAVSPDGSHIAYRTEQGSLAMRSLDAHSSCLVRSSLHDSTTRLAGFSADGVLYFETEDGPGRTAVNAWTPQRKERRRLSSPDDGFVLTAVPARPNEDSEVQWAVGMRSGSYYAALQADRDPEPLGLDDAVFPQRDDADIWTVHTEKLANGNRQVGLKRIVPRWSAQMRALAFDDPAEAYFADVDDPDVLVHLEQQFSSPSLVCMSTGAPGSWAYSCGNAGDKNFLAAPTTPSTENPFGKPREDPEIPGVDATALCGDAQREADGDFCEYAVHGCCYSTFETACAVAQCGAGCKKTERDQNEYDVSCVG